MGAWLGRTPWGVGCLLLAASGLYGAPPTTEQLRTWSLELEAQDFAVREAAGHNLVRAGGAAVGPLMRALAQGGPESRWRAGDALRKIAAAGDEAVNVQITTAMAQLCAGGSAHLAFLADELAAKQPEWRRQRAISRVLALGGRLAEYPPGNDEVGSSAADLAAVAPNAPEPPPDLPPPDDGFALQQVPAIGEAFVGNITGQEYSPPPGAELFRGGPIIDGGSGDRNGADKSLTIDSAWRGGDTDLTMLRDLPQIVSLQIHRASLTDAALEFIATLPRLARLDIESTPFTRQGLFDFRRRRPATRVVARGPAQLGVHAAFTGPCRLSAIVAGSGAHTAGLKIDDEIVAAAGHPIRDFSDLSIAVFGRKAGEKLRIEYKRNGAAAAAEVVLGERN